MYKRKGSAGPGGPLMWQTLRNTCRWDAAGRSLWGALAVLSRQRDLRLTFGTLAPKQ